MHGVIPGREWGGGMTALGEGAARADLDSATLLYSLSPSPALPFLCPNPNS